MKLDLSASHNVNQNQQLNIAPQLLQWLKILQAPTQDLSEMVKAELESNPALEITAPEEAEVNIEANEPIIAELPKDPIEEKTIENSETILDDSVMGEKLEYLAEIDEDWRSESSSYSSSARSTNEEDEERYNYMMDSAENSVNLYDHLFEQLTFLDLDEDIRHAVGIIIGSLDQRGHLSASIESLSADQGLALDLMNKALSVVQNMEPRGIGARNVTECLLLQLSDTDEDALARLILTKHIEIFATGQFTELAQVLGVNCEAMDKAKRRIRALNPEPGSAFLVDRTNYINADVVVRKVSDQWVIDLSGDIPHLRISASCRKLMDSTDANSKDITYARNKIRSAAFLIQGIRQREDTLRRVSELIIRFQLEFLESKTGVLKPLTMAKIANILKLHETTISRAISNKHMQTPNGLFPMKHFFKAGYQCADGSALTPESVKKLIKDVVRKENHTKPVRDVDIAQMLKKKGLNLARRTIAKYREEIGVPSSKERKINLNKPLKPRLIRKRHHIGHHQMKASA